MGLIGEAHCGKAPRVFRLGIEADGIGFKRQTGGVGQYSHRAVVIFLQRFLKARTPARRIGRQTGQREADGIEIETGIDAAATIETALRIGVVEILNHAGHLHTLVFVEGMFKGSKREAAPIHHEELADHSV